MIYNQPLIINVNMEFTSLVDGVIAFSSAKDELKIPPYEKQSYATSDQILTLDSRNQSIDGSVLPTVVPTVGGIIRSLQPVQFSDVNTGFGPTKSTRDDYMIGGNGSGGSDLFGGLLSEGLMSPFNAAYNYVSGMAGEEAGFGSKLLNGVTDFITGAAIGVSDVTYSLNRSIGQLTTVANAVTLGAFNNSSFAKTLRKNQTKFNQSSALLNQAAIAMNSINNTVQSSTGRYGSILDIPIR